jgi:hypothetical protein
MEVFSKVAIVSIFLTAIIPLVAGIIETIKENKQLDREREYRESEKTIL